MVWESTHPGGGGCEDEDELHIPLSPLDILIDYNPQFPQYTERFKKDFVIKESKLSNNEITVVHYMYLPKESKLFTSE